MGRGSLFTGCKQGRIQWLIEQINQPVRVGTTNKLYNQLRMSARNQPGLTITENLVAEAGASVEWTCVVTAMQLQVSFVEIVSGCARMSAVTAK